MGSMLTMTHSTSQTRSPQDSPSLPDQVRQTTSPWQSFDKCVWTFTLEIIHSVQNLSFAGPAGNHQRGGRPKPGRRLRGRRHHGAHRPLHITHPHTGESGQALCSSLLYFCFHKLNLFGIEIELFWSTVYRVPIFWSRLLYRGFYWVNSWLSTKSVLSLQTSHTNGVVKVLDVSDIKELSTSAIPAGIECGGGDSPGSGEHVTSIEVGQMRSASCKPANVFDHYRSMVITGRLRSRGTRATRRRWRTPRPRSSTTRASASRSSSSTCGRRRETGCLTSITE